MYLLRERRETLSKRLSLVCRLSDWNSTARSRSFITRREEKEGCGAKGRGEKRENARNERRDHPRKGVRVFDRSQKVEEAKQEEEIQERS